MSKDSDHLSGAVAFEASLTENGIKASAKSRFVSAVDRMFGGMFDVPAAFFEGKAAQRRMEDGLRKRAIEERGQIRLQGQLDIDRIEAAASVVIKKEQIEKIINKAAVSTVAFESLSGSSTSEESSSGNMDDDWLNIFGSYAANASSERARDLWGRILSGEVRKPGSFSLITLRVLSELDQRTAEIFQHVVRGVVDNTFLVKSEELRGQELIDATFLEEAGLLQEAGGMLNMTHKFDPTGIIILENQNLAIIARGNPGDEVRIPLISITRAGREILSILPPEASDVSLKMLAEKFKDKSHSIELVLITGRPAVNQISYQVIDIIKS